MRTKTDESHKIVRVECRIFLFQYNFLIKDFLKWGTKEKGEAKYVEAQT